MISAILSLLGSSAVGSILGGIFAFLNRRADLQAKQMDLVQEQARWAHDLALKDKDLEFAKAEAAGRKDVAIVEGEATIESARFTAIAAANQADRVTAEELVSAGNWRGWLVLVSVLNRLVRPGATVILAAAAIYLNLLLIGMLVDTWQDLSQLQRYDAAMQAFAWITGQAAAALGYWFVARGTSK
jgi:hypothetical protein